MITEKIKTRRSIRNYKNDPIPEGIIRELLETATFAPNGMNSQPWIFAVIEDRALLRDFSDTSKSYLLKLIDSYPQLARYEKIFRDPDYNIFYNAPALVLIYGDSGITTYVSDCSMAALNLMLAAHDKGIGSCWIGFANAVGNGEEMRKRLNIPDNYQLVAPLILGYPAQERLTVPPRKAAKITAWIK